MLKRILQVVGAVVLLLVTAVGALGYSMFGNTLPITDGTQLGKVRAVKDGIVQVFFLDLGGGQVALVDAGNDPEAKAIKAELARRGLTPQAVKAVFLTHGHGDHTAGLKQFPGAEVYAMQQEVDLLAGKPVMHSPASSFLPHNWEPVRVTHPLADGEVVKLGDLEVRAFLVPGHTQGSAAYLADGVLMLGDNARATKDQKLAPAAWFVTDSTEQNRASLAALADKLKPEEVKTLACAHTGTLSGPGLLQALAAAR
jgi:glyoxylase-like metal-dependent hydrolase (beta-lactamase superfamily II)